MGGLVKLMGWGAWWSRKKQVSRGAWRIMPAVFYTAVVPALVDGKRPCVLGNSVMKKNLVFHPLNPVTAK